MNANPIAYLLAFVGMAFGSPSAVAQPLQRCSTWEYILLQAQKDPQTLCRLNEADAAAEGWLKESHVTSRDEYDVPVVVHVVYKTGVQNISDAQIFSQIEVLNEDFNALNADVNKVPEVWKPVTSGIPIHFCLAAHDPLGNPTSGIERVQTTVSIFGLGDSVKHSILGGADAWPSENYLNIWVCNLGVGVLGYTTLPGTSHLGEDGVVVVFNAFGRRGTLKAEYNLGRTCTHEVGHWLGLVHPWGDDGGGCSGTDHIDDTPNEGGPSYGCPGFPLYDSCTPNGAGVMYMDYMDYTDDACMYMFTADQTSKMIAELNTNRASVLNSPAGCESYHFDLDASLDVVVFPTDSISQQSFSPIVQLSNRGKTELDFVRINYRVDGQPADSLDYLSSLLTGSTDLVTLPVYFTGEGGHVFTAWVSNPNHGSDMFVYNDSVKTDFIVKSDIPKNTTLIMPNPNNGTMNITIENPSAEGFQWRIINLLGQIIESGTSSSIGQPMLHFNLENLQSGIYFFDAAIGFDDVRKKFLCIQNP